MGKCLLFEYMAISLVNAVRSDIFFLSVTALICFVFDHLLCPARVAEELPKLREHRVHNVGSWRMQTRTERRFPYTERDTHIKDAIAVIIW